MSRKFCTACGHQQQQGYRFCPGCGSNMD
ncbi:zinc-ribbon domain-containing protein [Sutcliffiella halmapala]